MLSKASPKLRFSSMHSQHLGGLFCWDMLMCSKDQVGSVVCSRGVKCRKKGRGFLCFFKQFCAGWPTWHRRPCCSSQIYSELWRTLPPLGGWRTVSFEESVTVGWCRFLRCPCVSVVVLSLAFCLLPGFKDVIVQPCQRSQQAQHLRMSHSGLSYFDAKGVLFQGVLFL